MSSSSFPYGVLRAIAAGGSVVLSPTISVYHLNSGLLCAAGVAFQSDGSIDDVGPDGLDRTPINPGEWWSDEPDVGIGASYDIRCVSLSLGTWSIQAATVGTWIDISAERLWRNTVIGMASPTNKITTGLFAIRVTGGGPDLDTTTITAEAEN